MVKRITKVGNSRALVLDKAVMELIGLEENGQVQLVVSNGSLIVTPVHPSPMPGDVFDRSLKRVFARRRSALKKLSE